MAHYVVSFETNYSKLLIAKNSLTLLEMKEMIVLAEKLLIDISAWVTNLYLLSVTFVDNTNDVK